MKNTGRLSVWQVVLIALGAILILAPMAWDVLSSTLAALLDIRPEDIFTRSGMFMVGLALLSVVGVVEIVKDFRDKPKSKYIK